METGIIHLFLNWIFEKLTVCGDLAWLRALKSSSAKILFLYGLDRQTKRLTFASKKKYWYILINTVLICFLFKPAADTNKSSMPQNIRAYFIILLRVIIRRIIRNNF